VPGLLPMGEGGRRSDEGVPAPAILFEDSSLLVIDKPAGLVVHPAKGHWDGTLIDWLKNHLGSKAAGAFADSERLGLVHRLDKDTSGVLVIAKTVEAQTAVSRQFRDRTVRKTYIAFVEGVPSASKGVIDAPVGRSRRQPNRMAVSSGGRPSETAFEVNETFGKEVSQMTLHPKTGRTHQIRVHLAAIGHPIVGDRTYGAQAVWGEKHGIHRSLLHAERLEIEHPETAKRVSFHAPWPDDFKEARQAFREAFPPLKKAGSLVLLILLGGLFSRVMADDTTAAPAHTASTSAKHASTSSTSSAYRLLKREVASLKDQVDNLKTQVAGIQSSLDQLNASGRLRDLENAITQLNSKAVGSETTTQETKTQVTEMNEKLKIQQDAVDHMHDQLDRMHQDLIQLKAALNASTEQKNDQGAPTAPQPPPSR